MINRKLAIGSLDVVGVSISSVFIIGDAESISTGSYFDTPPTSLVVGPTLIPVQGTLQQNASSPATLTQSGSGASFSSSGQTVAPPPGTTPPTGGGGSTGAPPAR